MELKYNKNLTIDENLLDSLKTLFGEMIQSYLLKTALKVEKGMGKKVKEGYILGMTTALLILTGKTLPDEIMDKLNEHLIEGIEENE